MTAQIVIDDGTNPPATGSADRDASFLGNVFTLSNFDNTGVLAHVWTLADKPIGSAATLSSTNTPTTTITPDVPGTYLIQLQTFLDLAASFLDDADAQGIGVRFTGTYDWRIPAAGETSQFNPTRGWAAAREEAIRATQAFLDAGGGAVAVKDEGGTIAPAATSFDFVGAGVTASAIGPAVTVTIPGGGSAIAAKDEGGTVAAAATSFDFVGAGVVASAVGPAVTITIPGGSSSGIAAAFVNGADTDNPYSRVLKGMSPYIYWRLDEYTGATAKDSSANGHDGAIVDDVIINPLTPIASIGGAFRFNTVDTPGSPLPESPDGRVEVAVTDFPSAPITMCVWMRTTAGGTNNEFFHFASASAPNAFDVVLTNLASTTFQFTIKSAAPAQGTWFAGDGVPDVRDGNWHFVVIRWNGAVGELFIDGVSKGTRALVGGAITAIGEVWLGHSQDPVGTPRPGPASPYVGDLDEFALFSASLTNAQIQDLYELGNGERRLNTYPKLTHEVQLHRDVAPASTSELTTDGLGPGAGNRVLVPVNTSLNCEALLAARDVVTGDSAAYLLRFLVKRSVTPGSTALVGSVATTVIAEEDAAWDATVTIDTIAGVIQVNGTGDSVNTTKWTCKLTTTETYQP